MVLDGEAVRLALRQAMRQWRWRHLLAMGVARGGVASDPGIVVASVVAAPSSRSGGLVLAMRPFIRIGCMLR